MRKSFYSLNALCQIVVRLLCEMLICSLGSFREGWFALLNYYSLKMNYETNKGKPKTLETSLFCRLPGMYLCIQPLSCMGTPLSLCQRQCRVTIYILKFPEATKYYSFNWGRGGQFDCLLFTDIIGNDTAVNSVFAFITNIYWMFNKVLANYNYLTELMADILTKFAFSFMYNHDL